MPEHLFHRRPIPRRPSFLASSLCRAIFVLFVALFVIPLNNSHAEVSDPDFSWKSIETGYSFGRYELGEPDSVIRPEVFLLKFDLKRFQINLVRATSVLGSNADIRTLCKKVNGIAGINANFFDEQGRPLGLLIENSLIQQKLQRGGNLLGGVFAVRKGMAVIERRDSFDPTNVSVALQAGPRLIEQSRPVAIQSADETSRRISRVSRAG